MRTMFVRFLAGLLGLGACAGEAAPDPPAGAAVPAATATVAQPLATVRARIWQALQGPEVALQVLHHPALGPQFDDFLLHPNEQQRIDYHFRRYDGLNVADTVAMHLRDEPPATITPALRRYIALPVPARAADLLLQRGRGPFWPVPEYRDAQGQPLPYTCDHIVHFTALDATHTQLEIITLGSRVLDGKEWRLDGGQDGLGLPWPRRMPRSRDVAPSAADQQQVLARLVQLAQ
jgi:hypothetical protein